MHTPGPWVTRESWAKGPSAPRYVIEQQGTPRVVADCGNAIDARLIAAAPELLEGYTALRRILATVSPLVHSQGEALARALLDMDALLARIEAP